MVQFIMDRNVLLYVIAAACVAGVISQMILRQVYESLMKDTRNSGAEEGRLLQQLRQRFQYCSRLNEKIGDIHSFVQKGMIEYRFLGMSLHRWKKIGVDCLVLTLICAFAGGMSVVRSGNVPLMGNQYFWMGLLSIALIAVSYGISDTGYRRECLEIGLIDFLENSGAIRNSDSEMEGPELDEEDVIPMRTGRKARKRARAEALAQAKAQSRAQKEKADLKENLSRIKAGMQESAATREHDRMHERSHEQNVELLRQMDPRDQERILRDVLREVLS